MSTRMKVATALTVLFIAGFASGYLFHRTIVVSADDRIAEIMTEHRAERGEMIRRGPQRERFEDRIRERFTEALELEEDQQDPYFRRITEYHSTLHDRIRDQRQVERELIREHYRELRTDLSGFLREDQLQKLDQLLHPDSARHIIRRGGMPDRILRERGRSGEYH